MTIHLRLRRPHIRQQRRPTLRTTRPTQRQLRQRTGRHLNQRQVSSLTINRQQRTRQLSLITRSTTRIHRRPHLLCELATTSLPTISTRHSSERIQRVSRHTKSMNPRRLTQTGFSRQNLARTISSASTTSSSNINLTHRVKS